MGVARGVMALSARMALSSKPCFLKQELEGENPRQLTMPAKNLLVEQMKCRGTELMIYLMSTVVIYARQEKPSR